MGREERRAYWVAPGLLAWPLSLLPRGMGRESVGRPVTTTVSTSRPSVPATMDCS